ncbi:MAG: T9SS type A sorting domain-containing protein [Ferruginibacter sp.]
MMKMLPPTQKKHPINLSSINWQKYLLCLVPGLMLFFNTALANADEAGSPPLSGTYTVGPGGNYTTLTAAIADYNTSSLVGPVVFSLIATTYSASETFPIIINNNIAASTTNTLTIKPAPGVTASISGTLDYNALIKILGSYITIDGSNNGTTSRNLTIVNNGSSLGRVILIGSVGMVPTANTMLTNCVILAGDNSSNALILSDGTTINSPGYFNNITIDNNQIGNAYYGIYCNAAVVAGNGSGLLIQSNDLSIIGANAILYTGIFVQGFDGATVKYNTIGNFVGTDANTDQGIYIGTGTRNTLVLNNTVTNLNYTGTAGYGSRGIYINTNVTNAAIQVAGNMVANITGDGDDYTNSGVTLNNPVGILLIGPQTGIQIFHNSVFLGGVSGYTNTLNKANAISSCVRIYGSGSADIRNNILVNNLGLNGAVGFGATAIMVSFTNTQFTALNYNDYIINPTGSAVKAFGLIATTAQTSLSNWQAITGKDAASLNVAPVFVSSANLHLVAGSNPLLSNVAAPIAGFTENDIDNATRNPIACEPGCDEIIDTNTSFWVGKTSTNWATATNWEANAIPDATTDVLISGAYTSLPTITTTENVKNLVITNPATPVLTLNGGTLQVYGVISAGASSVDGANGTLEMNGSQPQNIPAGVLVNNKLNNLVIGNSNAATGLTLNGTLDIYRSVTFSASGLKLITNDNLTFKSTASETAWLGDVTGKTISGNVIVERYIPTGNPGPATHGKSWQLLAIPVSGAQSVNAAWQESAAAPNANPNSGYGTQITGDVVGATGVGFDVYTPAGASMKIYNASTGGYTGITNTYSLPIANQKGYMVFVRGDRSVTAYNQAAVPTVLRTKGKLFTTGADLPPATSVLANKFESIGNPYASAVDFTAITITGAVDNTYYVWDPLLAGNGYGGYQTISAVTGWKPSPGGTVNYPVGIAVSSIQSGQAFLVHATGAAGIVSFTEAAKISGSKIGFRTSDQNNGQFLRTVIYAGSDTTTGIADGNVVAFDADYSNEYDGDDALKFVNSSLNFGISSNGKLLAVEARNTAVNNDTIFYSLSNLRKQAYQFRIIPVNMQTPGLTAYLEDAFLHTSTGLNLEANTDVVFNVTDDAGSYASNRFYIVFKQLLILPVTFTNISATRNSEKSISVEWKTANETGIDKYEIERSADGRMFTKISMEMPKANNGSSVSYNYPDESPLMQDNFYRIRAISVSGLVQYSAIVKVATKNAGKSISVYPNPVVGKKMAVSFVNQPAGEYNVQLSNIVGQVVYKDKLVVNSSNTVKTISLDGSIAAGTYQLVITAADGTKNVERVVIR